jgi:hypothetical protein
MRHLLRRGTLLASVLLPAACGGADDATGPIPRELAATWEADRRCVPGCAFHLYTTDVPADSLNLLAWDFHVQIVLGRNGGFRMQAGIGNDTTFQGTARLEEDRLVVTDLAGSVDTMTFQLDDARLQITMPTHFRVESGDQVFDAPFARGILQRR